MTNPAFWYGQGRDLTMQLHGKIDAIQHVSKGLVNRMQAHYSQSMSMCTVIAIL